MRAPLGAAVLMALLVAGCDRKAPPAQAPAAPNGRPAVAARTVPGAMPADVVERTPTYLAGVTFPHDASVPAPLVAAMKAYADAMLARLKQAAQGKQPGEPGVPYDMSLEFRDVSGARSPFQVIAADGSLYTGGEQGAPLLKRLVWDRKAARLVALGDMLVATPEAWATLSAAVRESLLSQARTRLQDEGVPPAEIEATLKALQPMIEAGTKPDAANFEAFEPMLDAQGRLVGLTFVFPPYQVAGYADGIQRADVPVAVLKPHIAPAYQGVLAP